MSETIPPAIHPVAAKGLAVAAAHVPAFAGALVSLAFVGRLSWRGRVVAVVVGVLTAAFLAPAVIELIGLMFGLTLTVAVERAVLFLIGLSAMGTLPGLLKWMQRVAGDPLSLLAREPVPDPVTRPGDDDADADAPDGGAVRS